MGHRTAREATDRKDHVVILSAVLADPINIGYQHFANEVITHINKKPVNSMKDVFRIVDTDKHITHITLKSIGNDIVLAPDRMQEADKRIANLYRVSKLRHQDPPEKDK